jgi:C1A family cysteine protease
MPGFGWVKDKFDIRDFNVRSLITPEKKQALLPNHFVVYDGTIIYDQGQTSKCVAYSASGVKTDQEFIQYGKQYRFDANWLYSECKKIDGIPNENGTYPRIACKILQEKGDKLDTSNLCFLKKMVSGPDKKWGIDSYYRIDISNTDEDIKQILFSYGSFIAASSWYSNWMDKFTEFPEPNGIVDGGHAYRIIGWNEKGWIIANSWGTILWGDGGKATMSYDIFRRRVLSEGDCWKLVDSK